MDFEPPDEIRFPCLRLARQAVKAGGIIPAVLNAANEVAVAAFLERRIGFTEIADTVDHTLNSYPQNSADNIEMVLESDRKARQISEKFINSSRYR